MLMYLWWLLLVFLAVGFVIVKNMLSLDNNILEDDVVHSKIICVQYYVVVTVSFLESNAGSRDFWKGSNFLTCSKMERW